MPRNEETRSMQRDVPQNNDALAPNAREHDVLRHQAKNDVEEQIAAAQAQTEMSRARMFQKSNHIINRWGDNAIKQQARDRDEAADREIKREQQTVRDIIQSGNGDLLTQRKEFSNKARMYNDMLKGLNKEITSARRNKDTARKQELEKQHTEITKSLNEANRSLRTIDDKMKSISQQAKNTSTAGSSSSGTLE